MSQIGLVDPLPLKRTCDLWAKEKQLSGPRIRGLIAGWGLHVTTFFEQWGGMKAQASLDKTLVALPFPPSGRGL